MTEDIRDVLTEYEQQRQADRPAGLTASGLHPICPRQEGYRLQGVPPVDPQPPGPSAATVGTMLHQWYEAYWRDRDPAARVEQRTEHGQADVVRLDPPEVRDLKTLNRLSFDRWANEGGPDAKVWDQLAVYAHDHGLGEGAELVIDALCRETGRAATYRLQYEPAHGEAQVVALGAVEAMLTQTPPLELGTADRTGRGDWFCDRCPWASLCLNDQDDPALEPITDTDVERAAADYAEAQSLERTAKQMKQAAKKRLRGLTGQYGEWAVKWVEVDMPERHTEPYTMRYPRVSRRAD